MAEQGFRGGAAVVVAGVHKTFQEDLAPTRALRGVDLTIRRGEFVAVMGPSGSGKSTLLSVVAGLDTPDEGEVTVAGERMSGRSEDERTLMRRRHIGMVFQFFQLIEGMTALENVTLAAAVAGYRCRAAEARARRLLDLLGLSNRASHSPAALSGGQRQRLAIARALANDPTVVLADEPTGALDSAGVEEVLGLFQRLHQSGQTIVLVTHDAEVARAADRVLHMRDGRVVSPDDRAAELPAHAARPDPTRHADAGGPARREPGRSW